MRVVSFGEILWDVFESEKKIGGAPFNFAAHLVKNGVEASIYSAVGEDELGAEALEQVRRLQVDTRYISSVEQQTGVCLVTLQDGTPNYNIKLGTAMDAIPFVPLKEEFDGLYFGSLAQRNEISANSLQQLLSNYTFKQVFFDVNIRQHYYGKEVLERSISQCTILKISREEMGVLRETGISHADGYEAISRDLKGKYPHLQMIIITLDADGAFVYDCQKDESYYSEKPNCKVVSTVGAGDSFSATFFASVLQGASIPKALERASKVSTFVVTQLGAIPDYPSDLLDN